MGGLRWTRLTIGMTFRTQWEHYSKTICRDAKAHGAVTLATIVNSSTRCFGSYARGHRGEICPRITAAGRRRTADFAAGVTRVCGKNGLSCRYGVPFCPFHVLVSSDRTDSVGVHLDMTRINHSKSGSLTGIHLAADVRYFHPLAMGGEAARFPSRITSWENV
jgi:hypothetical protein